MMIQRLTFRPVFAQWVSKCVAGFNRTGQTDRSMLLAMLRHTSIVKVRMINICTIIFSGRVRHSSEQHTSAAFVVISLHTFTDDKYLHLHCKLTTAGAEISNLVRCLEATGRRMTASCCKSMIQHLAQLLQKFLTTDLRPLNFSPSVSPLAPRTWRLWQDIETHVP